MNLCMTDLNTLSHSMLIDLLDQQTNKYISIVRNGADRKEYDHCKFFLQLIIAEINRRKKSGKASFDNGRKELRSVNF